ncbi:hypothetical protein [Tunturiibacter gelidiferens]|uniref:hypothetical protein n=1 Tax=Tunturiibacter gelidiferens TaxID=3069689 RepID=UPI003D9B13F5
MGLDFGGQPTSDNCAEGNRHAVTCGLESTGDRFTGGDRVCECRSPSFSRMLKSDGLYPTTEECVALFQSIQCGVQLRDNRLGLIGNHDHFHTDFLVSHRNTSASNLMLPAPKQTASNSPQDYLRMAEQPGIEDGLKRQRCSALRAAQLLCGLNRPIAGAI